MPRADLWASEHSVFNSFCFCLPPLCSPSDRADGVVTLLSQLKFFINFGICLFSLVWVILHSNKTGRIWPLVTHKIRHLQKCYFPSFFGPFSLGLAGRPVMKQSDHPSLSPQPSLSFPSDGDTFLPAVLQSLMKIKLLWETRGTGTLLWLSSWKVALPGAE